MIHRPAWTALLTVLALAFFPGSVLADELPWHTDYDKALKEAKDRKVPLLIDLASDG